MKSISLSSFRPVRRLRVLLAVLLLLCVGLSYAQLQQKDGATTNRIFEPHKTITGHRASVWAVQFSPDGNSLASGSIDSTARLYDRTGTLRHVLRHPIGVTALSFSPNGRYLATACYDEKVRLWRVADGTLAATLSGHTGTVWAVAFSPDGHTLASSGEDKTIRLWKVNGETATLGHVLAGHTLNIWCVAFSPDSRQLASSSFDNTIKLWNTTDGSLHRTLTGHTQAVLKVRFSPDGQHLVSGSDDKTARVWNVADGQALRTLRDDMECVYGVAYSANGQEIATGSRDHGMLSEIWQHVFGSRRLRNGTTVRIWDATKGQLLQTLALHHDDVNSVAYSPDGTLLASASADNTVQLYRRVR